MRVSASIGITLKDTPPGYQGITGETHTIGKNKPVTFSNMVMAFAEIVSDFYTLFSGVDEMNAELDLLRDRLEHVKFVKREEQPCQPTAS